MTPKEGRAKGERRAERGIQRAALDHETDIERDTEKFLDAILSSPDGLATMDDAADKLTVNYRAGGRWRAAVPMGLKREAIIAADSVGKSSRPARHAGLQTVWRLTDRNAAERRLAETREFLRSNPNRPPGNDAGSTETAEPCIDFQI